MNTAKYVYINTLSITILTQPFPSFNYLFLVKYSLLVNKSTRHGIRIRKCKHGLVLCHGRVYRFDEYLFSWLFLFSVDNSIIAPVVMSIPLQVWWEACQLSLWVVSTETDNQEQNLQICILTSAVVFRFSNIIGQRSLGRSVLMEFDTQRHCQNWIIES